mmetsp:Transcript_42078/g.132596  ORF Transcript_42078/g.132596 Transcript_42078/m.132596 type:complete len:181 (-) Transcript_42078:400-942(-)
MTSLRLRVLECDLRCLAPVIPQTLETCERALPDIHLFVSSRVIQSMGSKTCATFVKPRTLRPSWDEEFSLMVEEDNAELEMVIYSFHKSGSHTFVGSVIVRLHDIENGETVDEWYPVKLNQGLRNGRGPEDPLLHVQLTVAQFRWEPLPPRPLDFIAEYRMPARSFPGRVCCSAPSCPVS